jgi:hypothetical protein
MEVKAADVGAWPEHNFSVRQIQPGFAGSIQFEPAGARARFV